MTSASPSPIEHLKTLLTEEVLNTVQSYFEIKIVHEEGGTLYLFLHDRVHELFHYYAKTQCCWVPTNPCSKVQIKGKLKKEQFDILFENDPLVQPTHETKDIKGRILQHCICPLAPRQSKDLDVTDLDFTLINCLIKTCRKTPAGHPQWLQDILEVRNELSHLGDTNDITADRVEAWWEKLENAAVNIAGTIGAAHKKGLERRISKIKTSQSQLEELMEALKSRDDQLEQKILSAIKNMGINIDGVHFRITTAKGEPNTCPDIAVPTSCTDPRKCIVGWKFYGPADWSISEMQKKLECIGIIGDFNIQFVHQGCLMVHTTIDRPILSDADVFREAVEEFLLLFTKRLKIPVTREGHPLDVVLSIRDHNAHNTTYEKTEAMQVDAAPIPGKPPDNPIMRLLVEARISLEEFESKTYTFRRDHGRCFVLNNKNFHVPNEPRLADRIGSDLDASTINTRFQDLGFNCDIETNLTKSATFEKFERIKLEMQTNPVDCFVLVILSHGTEDGIYATDQLVQHSDIYTTFDATNCPPLRFKPKVIITQSCRGGRLSHGVDVFVDPNQTDASADTTEYNEYILRSLPLNVHLPNEADFLFSFATVAGGAAFRDVDIGTPFIRHLSEAMEKMGVGEDFLSVLTTVNKTVGMTYKPYQGSASLNTNTVVQMPCFVSQLTKTLCLKPR